MEINGRTIGVAHCRSVATTYSINVANFGIVFRFHNMTALEVTICQLMLAGF